MTDPVRTNDLTLRVQIERDGEVIFETQRVASGITVGQLLAHNSYAPGWGSISPIFAEGLRLAALELCDKFRLSNT